MTAAIFQNNVYGTRHNLISAKNIYDRGVGVSV